jgi:cyclopropane-fatty-acyl-phospholipid synthase
MSVMMDSTTTDPPAERARARGSSSRRGASRARLQQLLDHADIAIDGSRPWDLQVHDERVVDLVFGGSLAIGEAYIDGKWDCNQLDELVCRFRRANLERQLRIGADAWRILKSRLINIQTPSRARHTVRRVYDGAIDLFEAMLDPRMVYSCAYWKDATTLAEAQEHKLDLACRKLGLQRGMHVLDIGCGWGSFVQYAAEKYGVTAVGITVSREQTEYARRRCKDLPVENRLVRPGVLGGHVRARRAPELPALLRDGPPRDEGRRPVPAPHRRRQSLPGLGRRLDR